MGELYKNQCVTKISEEYFEASENIKSARTSIRRVHWNRAKSLKLA